ncbi:hypothetical protein SAMN05216571_10965 [Onishia taeanensis]|jgi:hypothetical protein|uniref:Uncharacterized protein n=1 Tax=Onishia taeanensis TaxID=284577 RepID=A0A1G7T7Y2_9GAMM|nr:hypothetical protein [Halomonas taeanensis]MAX33428.1 hypothetical protein [Halomonadaceae bacterium]SDG31416.1 hypothetical protein SAMN05216571_10965 [Halomonas taeanensis]
MLEVRLELECALCGAQHFRIPTCDEDRQVVTCARCHSVKCRAEDLEWRMAQASEMRRRSKETLLAS